MSNILYYSNHLRGPQGEAGARTWHQVKCLSEQHFVSVIIPGIDPVTQKKVTDDTCAGLNRQKVKVIKTWTSKSDRSRRWRRVVFFVSAMAGQFWYGMKERRPDLVLSMSVPITQLLVARIIASIRRVPFGINVRDFPVETAREVGYAKSRRFAALMIWLETRIFRSADFILTVSPYYVEFLKERGVDGSKVTLAPIGYDDFTAPAIETIELWRQRMEKSLRKNSGECFIGLYAGTLGHAFPVEKIMNGAERLRYDTNVGFVFVGDGQREAEFKADMEKKGINGLFLGRQKKADVHAICRAVDFCIYPAAAGKFASGILGNKVFDYLGAGKPILYVGGKGAVRDVIEELGAGMFCEHEDVVFAENVLKLKYSESLRAKLSKNAAGFRSKNYTASSSAGKLAVLANQYSRR